MKNFLLLLILLLSISLYAQEAPQGFNYQGIARDADNNAFINQSISLRISLIDDINGIIYYTERHLVTTSDFGVFSIVIGEGETINGSFSGIDWSSGEIFIRTEIDPAGNTDYINMGESKLFSVPYALYAANGGTGTAGPQGEQGPQGQQGEMGLPGPEGPQGEQGETGPTGMTGPAGPPGERGQGIAIRGSVATLLDLPATAEQGDMYITQDDGHGHVWNATGFDDIGEIRGPEGPIGMTGPEGPQGIPGPEGPMGPQGEQGETGPAGMTGPAGPPGERGQGIAIRGSVATIADLPAMAAEGDIYITQNDGHGHVWNGTGFDDIGEIRGPEGPIGMTGPQGIQGLEGPEGPMGSQGEQGDIGPIGMTGPQGPQGLQGNPGPEGSQGIPGPEGPMGPIGNTGPTGPAGTYTAGSGIDISGDVISASDDSNENEIQALSLSGDILSLSDGGQVDLSGISSGLTLPYYQQSNDPDDPLFHIQNDDLNYAIAGTHGLNPDPPIYSGGIFGSSVEGYGVYGTAKGADGTGVAGISESTELGIGVLGRASNGIGGIFETGTDGTAALVTTTGKVGFGVFNPRDKVEIEDPDRTSLSLNGANSNGTATLSLFSTEDFDSREGIMIRSRSEGLEFNYDMGYTFQDLTTELTDDLTPAYNLNAAQGLGGIFYRHTWNGPSVMDGSLLIEGRTTNRSLLNLYPIAIDNQAHIMQLESTYDIANENAIFNLNYYSYDTTAFILPEPENLYSARKLAFGNQHDFTGRVSINGNDDSFTTGASLDLEVVNPDAKQSVVLESRKNADDIVSYSVYEIDIAAGGGGASLNPLTITYSDVSESPSGLGGIHQIHGEMQSNAMKLGDFPFLEIQATDDAKLEVVSTDFHTCVRADNDTDLNPAAKFYNFGGQSIQALGQFEVTSNNQSSVEPLISIDSDQSFYAALEYTNANTINSWKTVGSPTSLADNARYSIVFEENGVDSAPFNVTGDGKIGIGVSDPSETLEVDGGVRVNNTIRIGGESLTNLPVIGHFNTATERALVLNSGGAGINQNIVMLTDGNNSSSGLIPFNTVHLGTSTNRWRTIWSQNPLNSSSDRRLKKDIKSLESSLDKVMKMKPVSYQWKEGEDQSTHLGFIAQDMEEVIPEVVEAPQLSKNHKGETVESYYSISYSELIPVLTQAIQELKAEINELKEQLKNK